MSKISKIYYTFILFYISIIGIFVINNINYNNIQTLNDVKLIKNQDTEANTTKTNSPHTFIVKKQDNYNKGDEIIYFDNHTKKEYKIATIQNISGNVFVVNTQNNLQLNLPIYLIQGKINFFIPFFGILGNTLENIKDPVFFIILPALIIFLLEIYKLLKLFDLQAKKKLLTYKNFKDKIKLPYRTTIILSSMPILLLLLSSPQKPVLGYVNLIYEKINTINTDLQSITKNIINLQPDDNISNNISDNTSSNISDNLNSTGTNNPNDLNSNNYSTITNDSFAIIQSDDNSLSNDPVSLTNGERKWEITNENTKPSQLFIKAINIVNKENGCNDQERISDNDCEDTNTSGDIGKFMVISILKDDIIIATTTLDKKGQDDFGDTFTNTNPIILQPGEIEIIKMRWHMDESYYTNEIQGDEMTFNLQFTLVGIEP